MEMKFFSLVPTLRRGNVIIDAPRQFTAERWRRRYDAEHRIEIGKDFSLRFEMTERKKGRPDGRPFLI